MLAYLMAAARVLGYLVGFRRACAECRDPDLRVVSMRQARVESLLASVSMDGDD